jgi:hypothetical protein
MYVHSPACAPPSTVASQSIRFSSCWRCVILNLADKQARSVSTGSYEGTVHRPDMLDDNNNIVMYNVLVMDEKGN